MKPMQLALALKNLQGPDQTIDRELAIFAGYGVDATETKWTSPSNRTGPLPAFTTSVDAAYEFVLAVVGDEFRGCSWENGAASAKISDFPYIAAKTPAIAIVLAAVLARHFADKLLPELGAVKPSFVVE